MVQTTRKPGRDPVSQGADIHDRLLGVDHCREDRVDHATPTSVTSTGAPLTPATGCSTTKPVRLVRKSVSGVPSASKLRLPSAAPVIRAR